MKKVILITGCSSGIGYYTALTFARNGFTTFASARNLKSKGVSDLQKIAAEEKLQLKVVQIDITDIKSIESGIKNILEKAGKIDVLVNNAGVMFLGPIETFSSDEVKLQFETNYFGVLNLINKIVPLMRNQKSGYIINVSSINGLIALPLYGLYASSKYALEAMSETLRFELSHFGIKVAIVEPGVFLTNFWKNRKHPLSLNETNSPYKELINYLKAIDERQQMRNLQFLQKILHPQKVANAIYNLSQKSNPPIRNIVGIDPKIFYFLRRILPFSIWTWFLHKIFKW